MDKRRPRAGAGPGSPGSPGGGPGGDGQSSSDDGGADPRIGRQYGKYIVNRLIGAGGMATVYEAEDATLGRRIAIKFLPEARKEQHVAVERFINEAQVAGRLNHPNIIAIYDIGYEHDAYYIAMELLNPGSSGHFIKRNGRMGWVEACAVMSQCCSGLTAAHNAGIVHRDIKPDNILCSPAGTAKLADFGLVKELFDEAGLTKSGVVVGTPLFMSPEQASAQPLDARTDLYSLGASFYALLTGSPPYTQGSVPQIMMAHCKAPIPDPRSVAPEIPESVVKVMKKAMAKRPADRFQTAEEMRLALEQILESTENKPPYLFLVKAALVSSSQRPRPLRPRPELQKPEGSTPKGALSPVPVPSEGSPTTGKVGEAIGNDRARAEMQSAMITSRRGLLLGGAGLVISGGVGAALYGFGNKNRGRGTGNGTDPTGKNPAGGPRKPPIKIGLINSLSGVLAISARPVIDASILAIEEINARGGVLGSLLEPEVVDGKSDNLTFGKAAEKLIVEGKVQALFGGWSSSNRRNMKPVVEKYQSLLLFPARDEGLEDSLNIIYCGPVPNQLVLPALTYVLDTLKKQRLYYMGTDGLFSHTAAELIRDQLKNQGLSNRLVGEEFALLGEKNFKDSVKRLQELKPDIILCSLIGESNVDFIAEMRASGISPQAMPVLSFSIGENELLQMANLDLRGDYLVGSYFQSLQRVQNVSFVERFRKKYGAYRVTSAVMEAAYASVYLWAQAVEAAGTSDPGAVRAALRNQSFDGPGGLVKIDPSNNHTWRPFRVAQMAETGLIIVGGSEELIPPMPFPSSRTRAEWEAFSGALYKQWDNNWVNPRTPDERRATPTSSTPPSGSEKLPDKKGARPR